MSRPVDDADVRTLNWQTLPNAEFDEIAARIMYVASGKTGRRDARFSHVSMCLRLGFCTYYIAA
jgi:hypothetical protein